MTMIDPSNDPAWPMPRTDGPTPELAFPVPFSIGIGLSLVVWTIVAQLVMAVVFTAAGADLDEPLVLRQIVIASQVLAIGGAAMMMQATGRLSWRLWGPARPQWRHIGVGLAAGIGGYLIVIGWAVAWTVAFGEPEPIDQALLDDMNTSTMVLALSFVAAVVMAPIVEEVIFRGVLFQASRRSLGLWPGIILSSLVFVAVHVELYPPIGSFQPVGLGGLALLAGWLAWIFHRTGSLTVPIFGHAVFNAINLSLAAFATKA